MLSESVPVAAGGKRIGVFAHSEGLQALLRGLLAQWHYTLVDAPAADELLLAEEGLRVPAAGRKVLWLTRCGGAGSNRLSLPLPVEELWRQLESRYHRVARNHIRIPVQLPATLQVRDESTAVRMVSLSDMGGRFDFPWELVKGEQLGLQTVLEGERLTLEGRVIYVVPRGELEGTGRSEIGMVFDRTPPETRRLVREYIIWRCLAQARPQVPEELFGPGLDFFQIPPAVLQRLA